MNILLIPVYLFLALLVMFTLPLAFLFSLANLIIYMPLRAFKGIEDTSPEAVKFKTRWVPLRVFKSLELAKGRKRRHKKPDCFVTEEFFGKNLDNLNLNNKDFKGQNMSQANLAFSELCGSDLRGADLTDSVLCSANLSAAKLHDANLTGAYFDMFTISPFSKSAARQRGMIEIAA